MTPERWQQVKELFHTAIALAPDDRSLFLSSACRGDEALRREVEALIAAHEQTGSFIDAPAYEVAADVLVQSQSEMRAGEKIAQYEIISMLGAGGMGEVYLAEDTKLGRRVALKLLPTSFTKDLDRLRRFGQEARAASALNHPNIITIHEIGETASVHFIATEFVEGETLRERMRQGMSLQESLNVAVQVADALAAAHKAGIIHRDIKPDNIMLRADGYAKVLDFGLAKLVESPRATASAEAVTRMKVKTAAGVFMGTAAYMSPEQARGLNVDERTDIWSLGVVIYEMVAGHEPFEGETPQDIIASILKTEAPPLSHYAPEAPSELVRICTKALRKDREERYQGVRDLLLDLKSLKEELEFEAKLERSVTPDKSSDAQKAHVKRTAGLTSAATTNRSAVIATDEIKETQLNRAETSAAMMKRRRTTIIAALAVLLVAALAFVSYKLFFQRKSIATFQAMSITRLTNNGKAIHASISPDGKYFAYVLSDAGKQSLILRLIDATSEKEIVAPAPVGYFGVNFSPDGSSIYYSVKKNDAGTLYRIPVLGGTPVKVLEKIDSPISFSPDGRRFAFVRGDYPNAGESGLYIADADGSNEREISARKLPDLFFPNYFTGPSWSPDGKLIASSLVTLGHGASIIAVRVDDGKEEKLTTHSRLQIGRVEWLPDMSGLIILAKTRENPDVQVWYLSYPAGEERHITNDLNNYRGLSFTADFNKFVTVQTAANAGLSVIPNGDIAHIVNLSTGNIFTGGGDDTISWTPDGRLVYGAVTNGVADIWMIDADGNNRRQVTVKAYARSPVVSPDGRSIVFISLRDGPRHVWRMDMDGSNQRQLTNGLDESWPSFSPDGQWVVYSSYNSDNKVTLWKVPTIGGTPVEVTANSAQVPVVSPDGKWIAYLYADYSDAQLANNAPPNKIAVIPFEGGVPVKTFDIGQSASAQTILRWSNDGHSLLYTVNNTTASNIWNQPIDGGKPTQVTNFTEGVITTFSYSRDGRTLVCSRGTFTRDAVLISNAK